MSLLDKLKPETIIFPLKAQTQPDAIKEILENLQKNKILKNTTKLFSYIKNNEKQTSSAVGRGVAYPHSISEEINELICVLAISKNGIDFNCPDGQLCHIILLTLSTKFEPCEHRKFITKFRNMIQDPIIRSEILESNESFKIINIIHKWEDDDSLLFNNNY